MKHGTLRRLSSLLLAFVMAFSLAVPAVAAEGDLTVTGDPAPTEEAMPMTVGDTQTLTAKAEGAGTDETVTWLWSVESGSDAVSLDGAADQSTATIQAKAAGQATVKATATAGGKTGSVSWQVEVSPAVESIEIVDYGQTLDLDPSGDWTDGRNSEAQLRVNVVPNDAKPKIQWSSSDSSIATVDENGLVKGVSPGEATITATAGEATSSRQVVVRGVRLNTHSVDVRVNQQVSVDWETYGSIDNSAANTVSWRSSDESVAGVANGNITGRTAGSATVTVQYYNQTTNTTYRDSCDVSVKDVSANAITAEADSGNPLAFSSIASEINGQCRQVLGESLSYITGLTVDTDAGTLYYGYVSAENPGLGVASNDQYYYSGSTNGRKSLNNITFVPKGEYSGTAVINYVAYGSSGNTFSGTIRVDVDQDSTDVTYSTTAGQSVTFRPADFNSVCQSRRGVNLKYVTFSLPSSARGTLYYKYTGSANYAGRVTSNDNYYYSGTPNLADVTFVPAENYTGTVTISYTARDSGNGVYNGKVTITVAGGGGGDISYQVSSGDYVTFNRGDFNDLCRDATGRTLDYIRFTSLPSSSEGTLYYRYRSSGSYDSQVTANKNYYYSTSGSNRISEISFVPNSNYSGGITIPFTGYNTSGDTFSGVISIEVGEGASANITYNTDQDTVVTFDVTDFDDASQAFDGERLDYVRFTSLPGSSRGTLYYDYRSSSNKGTAVSASTRYYRNQSRYLDNVSFVPDEDYTGTVSIPYTGTDVEGHSFKGTVTIRVGEGGEETDVSYSVSQYGYVTLDDSDFNDASKSYNNRNLNRIRFASLPSSSQGRLYYDYKSNGNYDEAVSTSTSYYRSSNPRIDKISFVPASGYTGTVTIPYTGYDTNGDDFKGNVIIRVKESGELDVVYTAMEDTVVRFDADDFNQASQNYQGRNLNYVRFTTLPSSSAGTLYYNYEDADDKGNRVSASTSYYRSNGSNRLDNVYFVPDEGYTGTVNIPYTGYDSAGRSFKGTVSIRIQSPVASAIYYTTANTGSVTFRPADFNSVCQSLTGNGLKSVQFQLPASSQGRLTYGTGSGSAVSASTQYQYSGSPSLAQVVFTPTAGYSGTVDVSYTGYDEEDNRFTGTVRITVSASTTSAHFNDLGSYTWAVPAIDYLYGQGVVTGVGNGRFDPAGRTTRGQMALMLVRAFQFPQQSGNGFRDVPASSIYRNAIITAQALGIVEGDTNGNFRPDDPITRQDAFTMLSRAMRLSGWSFSDGTASDLAMYADGSQVSSYAVGPVGALVRLNIVQGDNQNKLNPRQYINRAETSVILYRALTIG